MAWTPAITSRRKKRVVSAVLKGKKFLRGSAPYFLGGFVSEAARRDVGKPLSQASVPGEFPGYFTPSFIRRNASFFDELMDEYYFG